LANDAKINSVFKTIQFSKAEGAITDDGKMHMKAAERKIISEFIEKHNPVAHIKNN